MKTILAAVAAVLCLSAVVSAQTMPGGGQGQQHPGGGMVGAKSSSHTIGAQPSSPTMDGQMMMEQDMMRDMIGMMGQMDQVLQKMSRSMEGQMPMDRMQKMSGGMAEMSVAMRQMSEHMTKGTMDAAAMKAMQERMKNLDKVMDDLSTQGK